MKRVIAIDMQGPVYRYSEKPGIQLVENISPEEAALGDQLFEESVKRYNIKKGGKYASGIRFLSSDPEQAELGSIGHLLEAENDLVSDVLQGKDAPCGFALNLSAAKYVFKSIHEGYNILVVSTSMIPVSKSILERTLDEYKKNTQTTATNALFDASDLELHKLGISVCKMAEFGSKKDYKAWQKVFENYVIAPFIRDKPVIDTIIEDDGVKCRAALTGASEAMKQFKNHPLIKVYHQITPDGPV